MRSDHLFRIQLGWYRMKPAQTLVELAETPIARTEDTLDKIANASLIGSTAIVYHQVL